MDRKQREVDDSSVVHINGQQQGYGTYENVTWKREMVAAAENRHDRLNVHEKLNVAENAINILEDSEKIEVVDAVQVIIHENPLEDDENSHQEDLRVAAGGNDELVMDGSPIECNSNLMVSTEPRHTI